MFLFGNFYNERKDTKKKKKKKKELDVTTLIFHLPYIFHIIDFIAAASAAFAAVAVGPPPHQHLLKKTLYRILHTYQ